MKYTLATPITVGDITQPIVVDSLELASFAANFEPTYSDQGTAILSVVLVHRASGYKVNIVFNDAQTLSDWQALDISAGISQAVFTRLVSAGKIPLGTLA